MCVTCRLPATNLMLAVAVVDRTIAQPIVLWTGRSEGRHHILRLARLNRIGRKFIRTWAAHTSSVCATTVFDSCTPHSLQSVVLHVLCGSSTWTVVLTLLGSSTHTETALTRSHTHALRPPGDRTPTSSTRCLLMQRRTDLLQHMQQPKKAMSNA